MTVHHLNGEGTIDWLLPHAPDISRRSTEDLVLADVDICFCLIEMPVADALRVLPPAVHPSLPGMVGLLNYSIPDSPFGPFEMVLVGIMARSGIKSRLIISAGFINNHEAGEHLRRTWGFPLEVAELRLSVNYDRVRSTVQRDGNTLLSFEVQHPVPLTGAGGNVRYPQPFNLAKWDGAAKFVQVDASYGFDRVARGTPRLNHCAPELVGGLSLSDDFPVTGTLAKVKMTLHPVRFIAATDIRAEDGGVTALR